MPRFCIAFAEHVEPLLEQYGVQMYLAGHDHDLELQRGPGSGVTHVLTGAGSQTRGFRGTTDSLFQHAASGAAMAKCQRCIVCVCSYNTPSGQL